MPVKKTIHKTQRGKSTPAVKEEVKTQERSEFYCTRCGRKFKGQKGNFLRVQSPLWEHNNRYLPVCSACTDELYEHYVETLGSVQAGMRRICLHFDIYYDIGLLEATVKGSHSNLLRAYISKTYLTHVQGKTFDDTMDVEAGIPFEKPNEFEKFSVTTKPKTASQRQIDEWGSEFSPPELAELDAHYKELTQYINNDNFAKDTLIRDLCMIYVQKKRVLKDGDMAQYEKLTKLYQSTLTSPVLKNSDDQMIGYQDAYGKWLLDIEQYAPAEYYADKNRHWDFFGIGEYIKRFMTRPLKNLMLGTRERDPEYSVGDDDAG